MAEWPEFNVDELLRRLTARGVDYIVIGGVATILLGGSQQTADLDVCVSREAANLEALGEVLIELGAKLRGVDEDVPFVPDERTLRRVQTLTLSTTQGPLDLLMQPDGAPPYAQLRRNAERKDVGGFTVLVASIDDLIAMKRAAGRDKDTLAIEELETIKRLRRRLGRE